MARIIPLCHDEDWEAVPATLVGLLIEPDDARHERRARSAFRVHGLLVNRGLDAGVMTASGLSARQIAALNFAATARFGARNESLARHSLYAGSQALKAVYGDRIRLPQAVGGESLEKIGAWLRVQGQMDERNYQQRVWKRTRPVLNLATALCMMLLEAGEAGREGALLDLCLDKTFVAQWILEANRIGPSIEAACYRRSAPRPQPRFELIEVACK